MALVPTAHDEDRKKRIEQMKRDKEIDKDYQPKDGGKTQNAKPGPDVDGRGTEKAG